MSKPASVRKYMKKNKQIKLYGSYKIWHINGQLSAHVCAYRNKGCSRCCIHGECINWYDYDGCLKAQRFFKHGKLHGECKFWYNNNQLGDHYFYFNGHRHGEFKRWDHHGRLLYHRVYEHGKYILCL